MLLQCSRIRFKQIRSHNIVAIEKHHPLSGGLLQTTISSRSCTSTSFLQNRHLEIVGLVTFLKIEQHLQSVVLRIVVYQNQMYRTKCLSRNRIEGSTN